MKLATSSMQIIQQIMQRIQQNTDEATSDFMKELNDMYQQMLALVVRQQLPQTTIQSFNYYKYSLNQLTNLFNQINPVKTVAFLPIVSIQKIAQPQQNIVQLFDEKFRKLLPICNASDQLAVQLENHFDHYELIQNMIVEIIEMFDDTCSELQLSQEMQCHLLISTLDEIVAEQYGKDYLQHDQKSENAAFMLLLEETVQQAAKAQLQGKNILSATYLQIEQEAKMLIQQMSQYVKQQLEKFNALLPPQKQINGKINAYSYKKLLGNIKEFIDRQTLPVESSLLADSLTSFTETVTQRSCQMKILNLRLQRCLQKQQKQQANESIFQLVQKQLQQTGKYQPLLAELSLTECALTTLIDQHVQQAESFRAAVYAASAWKQFQGLCGDSANPIEVKQQCISSLQLKIQQFKQQEQLIFDQLGGQISEDAFDRYVQISLTKAKHIQAAATLEKLEFQSLQQYEAYIDQIEEDLNGFRAILYRYMQEAAKQLTGKLVMFQRFESDPELFLEQRIIVKRNKEEIEQLQSEIELIQLEMDTKLVTKSRVAKEFAAFTQQQKQMSQQIKTMMRQLELIQSIIGPGLVEQQASEDVIAVAASLFQGRVESHNLFQQKIATAKKLLGERLRQQLLVLSQSITQFKEADSVLNAELQLLLQQLRAERERFTTTNFAELSAEYDKHLAVYAEQYVGMTVGHILNEYNAEAQRTNRMAAEDDFAHRMRFKALENECAGMQSTRQSTSHSFSAPRSIVSTSRSQIVQNFVQIVNLGQELSTASFKHVLPKMQQKLAAVETFCTDTVTKFKTALNKDFTQFRDAKSASLSDLYQRLFQSQVALKISAWGEQTLRDQAVEAIREEIDVLLGLNFPKPLVQMQDSAEQMLDEQIRLNSRLRSIPDQRSEHGTPQPLQSDQPEADEHVQPLKESSVMEGKPYESIASHIPERALSTVKADASHLSTLSKHDTVQELVRQVLPQARASNILQPKLPQATEKATLEALEYVRERRMVRRVMTSGFVDCFVTLIGDVVKIEQNDKPAQQIKLKQVKQIRFKVMNMLGIEVNCFELYLETAKSAVFAVESKKIASMWVTALRKIVDELKK